MTRSAVRPFLVLIVVAAASCSSGGTSFRVMSCNMAPALLPGYHVHVAAATGSLNRGDIVYYVPPTGTRRSADDLRVSRVVGLPGEHIEARGDDSADVAAAVAFWSEVVGVPVEEFQRTTLKRHKPRTVRHNIGETYHGCLTVRVLKSVELNPKIAGWWEGLSAGLSSLDASARSGVV